MAFFNKSNGIMIALLEWQSFNALTIIFLLLFVLNVSFLK
jgi:hypothetical protein